MPGRRHERLTVDRDGKPITAHGKVRSYSSGCRCDECVQANRDYYARRKQQPEYMDRKRERERDRARERRGTDPSRYRLDGASARSIEECRAVVCPGCAAVYTFRPSGFCKSCEALYQIGVGK